MALVIGKKPAGETLDGLDGVTDGIDLIIGNAGADIIFFPTMGGAAVGDDDIRRVAERSGHQSRE